MVVMCGWGKQKISKISVDKCRKVRYTLAMKTKERTIKVSEHTYKKLAEKKRKTGIPIKRLVDDAVK